MSPVDDLMTARLLCDRHGQAIGFQGAHLRAFIDGLNDDG